MTELTAARDDAIGPQTAALIAACAAEQAQIYPPEHSHGFSPEALREARSAVVVASRGDLALGCGALTPFEGYGELKRLYVVPAARGTGVFEAVIDGLVKAAASLGLDQLYLETGIRSPAALRAYEKVGFSRCGPFGAYREDGSSVFMERRL